MTTQLTDYLNRQQNFELTTSTRVIGIRQNTDATWTVVFKNLKTGRKRHIKSRFVFIGAGGSSLKLLQMTGLPETKQYADFPIGGTFLVTDKSTVTNHYTAKMLGRATLDAPALSAPHFDTRTVDGKKYIFFGPFTTYTNKFSEAGSSFDLLKSLHKDNILPMLSFVMNQINLVEYLMRQSITSYSARFNQLKEYYPEAKQADWTVVETSPRVQIIKQQSGQPQLQLGTEVFVAKDHSIAAILGTSSGSATSPYTILNLLEKAFPEQVETTWNPTLHQMIHSYHRRLSYNPVLLDQVRQSTSQTLGLPYTPLTHIDAAKLIAMR